MSEKRIKKTFRIEPKTMAQLEQIVEYENGLPQNRMISRVNEREILERAIEYYHSAVFGEEVLDLRLDRMTDIMANKIDIMLRPLIDTLASSSNTLHLKTETMISMFGLYFHMMGFKFYELDEPNDVKERIEESQKLSDYVKQILIDKYNL